MAHLEGITTADLREALDDVAGSRASRRLIAAIAYKHGVAQTELAEWFDVERKTVYNWLSRLDERPAALVGAARDAPRPGRPSKLTETQQAALVSVLNTAPEAAGYGASAWTPSLVREFVRDEFDVEYSIPACSRLLGELDGR